ncbi:MAG: glycosyltransferase family 2 protein [Lachnospiraceae bacterium]|nr:glycosyltransferase family 2 protein [Lachnospiraceae bacterium]
MEDITNNRREEINKLKQLPLSGRDKDIINKIEGLYIKGYVSNEVLAEYLKKNLSNKEIANNFENSIRQENKIYNDENLPLVSVIIPTYGGYLPIAQTIDSVLKQNYGNIEIIIMDDAGNTVTKEFILNKYKENNKIRYFQSKTKIFSGADKRKFGFQKSLGEYIVFLDHDDYYIDSNFFRRAVYFFEKHNKYGKKIKETFSAYCSNVFLYNQFEDYYDIKGLNVSGGYTGEEFLYGLQIKYDKPFSVLPSIFVREKLLKSNILKSNVLNDSVVYMYACLSGNLFISDYVCGAYRIGANISSKFFTFDKVMPVMEEKRNIMLQASKKYPNRNWNEWLLKQIELTLDFAEKHKGEFNIKELCNIELWGFWHCKKEFKECGKYFLAKYIEYNTSYSRSENKKTERLQGYYELLNKWVSVKSRGAAIDEFLIKQGWKNVSIYGYGEIGKRLYEEIGQSQLVNVVSVIDNSYKSSDIFNGISICSLSDELPIADITIITPVFAFENIKKDLNKKGIICCISIEEILNKI